MAYSIGVSDYYVYGNYLYRCTFLAGNYVLSLRTSLAHSDCVCAMWHRVVQRADSEAVVWLAAPDSGQDVTSALKMEALYARETLASSCRTKSCSTEYHDIKVHFRENLGSFNPRGDAMCTLSGPDCTVMFLVLSPFSCSLNWSA